MRFVNEYEYRWNPNRPPETYTFTELLNNRYQSNMPSGDNTFESVNYRLDQLRGLLEVLTDTLLTDDQKLQIAKSLGYKQA